MTYSDNVAPQFSGMTVTPTQDPLTGEYGEMVAQSGHPLSDDFQSFDPELTWEETGEQRDLNAEYEASVMEAYPQASEAIAFATAYMDPESVQEFNAALDAGDWDYVMPKLEDWVFQYQQAVEQGLVNAEDIQDMLEDSPEDFSQEDVDAELDYLQTVEPEGLQTASDNMQEAEELYEQGLPAHAAIMMAASQYHSGQMTLMNASTT